MSKVGRTGQRSELGVSAIAGGYDFLQALYFDTRTSTMYSPKAGERANLIDFGLVLDKSFTVLEHSTKRLNR
jgi:hypothetical protein